MNKDLQFLLDTGNITSKRSLEFYEGDTIIAYTTEYHMNANMGPLSFWITWKHPNCNDEDMLWAASIYSNAGRARLYFPAYLDTRIPPINRDGLEELQREWGIEEYDKFEWAVKTEAKSPIKRGVVREIEPIDCDLDEIHAIEEVVKEYLR